MRVLLNILILLFIPGLSGATTGTSGNSHEYQNGTQGSFSGISVVSGPSAVFIIDQIDLKGNILTRNKTIMRELPFQTGDTLDLHTLEQKAEAGRLNLMNTGLFNFVKAHITTTEQAFATVTYSFVERWNIWPLPVIELDEPNLNQWLESPSFSTINYGMDLLMMNLTGRNERTRILVKAGNVQSLGLSVQTPLLGKHQAFRTALVFNMNRTKRRAYATEDNQQLYYRDPDDFISNEYRIGTSLSWRPGYYNTQIVRFYYHYHDYADTLTILNPRFGPNGESRFSFFSLSYIFRRDRRDIAAYPLDGYLAEAGITKKGLWFPKDSEMDVTTLEGTIRHYIPLRNRWYAAWSMTGKWSEGTTLSYFDQEGLGFTHALVRGYESYLISGQKYVVAKSNIKYNLLPERESTIGFIRNEKFSRIHYALYANIFLDAGMISDRHTGNNETLANRWLAGAGAGLDFHTYYDTVLRAEFTINRHGRGGVFFHLSAPI
ncbi:MAG: hypothetical protein EA394_02160 [Bacteroidia bacterium]|nr:MAG: hypothetical protein EA394_02160 [Bacteroidia bacterium]